MPSSMISNLIHSHSLQSVSMATMTSKTHLRPLGSPCGYLKSNNAYRKKGFSSHRKSFFAFRCDLKQTRSIGHQGTCPDKTQCMFLVLSSLSPFTPHEESAFSRRLFHFGLKNVPPPPNVPMGRGECVKEAFAMGKRPLIYFQSSLPIATRDFTYSPGAPCSHVPHRAAQTFSKPKQKAAGNPQRLSS